MFICLTIFPNFHGKVSLKITSFGGMRRALFGSSMEIMSGPWAHDLPCGRCLRCWTAWCDAATFEKSSSGTTPNAREQLLLRSCGVLLLISKYLFLLFSYFYTALAQRVTGNPSSVPQSGNVEMMTSLFLADISMA